MKASIPHRLENLWSYEMYMAIVIVSIIYK